MCVHVCLTCWHCHVGWAHSRIIVSLLHMHGWVEYCGQGEHGPTWQAWAQLCRPHDSLWPHFCPHDHSLLLQRCGRAVLFPQWQVDFTILGHGGHGPEIHRTKLYNFIYFIFLHHIWVFNLLNIFRLKQYYSSVQYYILVFLGAKPKDVYKRQPCMVQPHVKIHDECLAQKIVTPW